VTDSPLSPDTAPGLPNERPPLSHLGQQALALAALDWQVFQLSPRSKIPFADSHGFKDATDDEDVIRRWWSEVPDANIGVATGDRQAGGSGVWSIDFDTEAEKAGKPGKDGLAVRAHLEADHGPLGGLVLETSRGVQHIYLFDERSPQACQSGLEPGVDIRSNGGYFVAPPSVHPTGKVYQWGKGQPGPAPGWLCEWIAERSPAAFAPPVPGTPAGITTPPTSNGKRAYSEEAYEEYRQMLKFVPGLERDDWLRVGFALYELGWGKRGYELWVEWSRNWPAKYDANDQCASWASFGRGYAGLKITIASVVALARKGGWRLAPHFTLDDLNLAPIPFFDRSDQVGPPILIDDLFGDAPRFASYLHAAREYLQVPESTISLAHLAGLSAVTAKRLVFDNGQFQQPPVLWQLSLIRTGGRKSEIVDLVRDPILGVTASSAARELRANALDIQQRLTEELDEEKKKSPPSQDKLKVLRFELANIRGRTADLSELLTSDTTEAGLQEALLQSGGAVFICDGEAAALNNAIAPSWAKGGAPPQTTTWLNAFSGKSMIVKRSDKRRRQGLIKKPELAICLVVQTGAPTAYLFDHKHLRDSGFMARFLFDVPSFRPEEIEVAPDRPSPGYEAPWREIVEAYLLAGIPLDPQVIDFTPDADAMFLAFRREHQREFKPGGANHDLPEFHAKVQGTLTRVAGLIATARAFETYRFGSAFQVETADVERTLALFPRLVEHVRAAFGLDSDPSATRDALRVLHAAFRHYEGGGLFSATELRRGPIKMKMDPLRAALALLVENRWLLVEDEVKWRFKDPRVRFHLNPKARREDVPLA